MSKTVVGIFDTQDHAEAAARRVKERGLRTDDISIVVKQGESETRMMPVHRRTQGYKGGWDAGFGTRPATMAE